MIYFARRGGLRGGREKKGRDSKVLDKDKRKRDLD